jgi:imidazolonepropionase-like amidohydrolase
LVAAAEQAAASGVWLSAHARPAASIKQALRHGFRVLYHCDFIDEEGLDLLEARRDEVFVGPTVATTSVRVERGHRPPGISDDAWRSMSDGLLETYARNVAELRRRGIRILVGGDYGLDDVPHGDNARDLAYLVRHCGLTPIEALVAATRTGGELMGLDVGMIRPGYLADLLLVDGDPTSDIAVLADETKLLMVMKGGTPHRLAGRLARQGGSVRAG